MGFFNWLHKGVDVEGDEEEEVIQAPDMPEEMDAELRRKQAFNRLVNGEGPITPQSQIDGKKTVQIYLIKTNDDIGEVVEKLRAGEPAIVNLSKISKAEILRTQDFLSGVVFVLKAHISTFAPNIFLITPHGVVISNE